jgi:serine/threonine protein kinase
MKIDYLSSEGIHHAEKAAMEQMRTVFNASAFSEQWHGFAGFEMIDRVHRDREIDVIIITHDRFIIIELKNWRGTITPMQDHWLLNGNDMGRSPVKVTADKSKILSSKLKKLKFPIGNVWLDYRVVLCGTADASAINPDERQWVSKLDDFLKISTKGGYQKVFSDKKAGAPLDHLPEYRSFFKGPEFRPTTFSFQNFQIDGDVVFPHPDGLYKEYKSVKRDDVRHQALLRRWDFSTLAGKADTIDERAQIALREHQALGYILDQNEDLSTVVLQPLSHPTRDDVNADFCELYKLPTRQVRLSDFINRYTQRLTKSDRLNLAKVLIAHLASLHDIGVAHRDLGDHSVWIELPSRVSISGWVTAFFPEVATIGTMRNLIRAGSVSIPEDVKGLGDGVPSDPFRRDVYLLGVIVYYLLFLQRPQRQGEIAVWSEPEENPYDSGMTKWLAKAFELIPADRYANARVMLDELNSIPSDAARPGLDMKDFEPYRTDVLPVVAYPMEENVKQGRCHLYKSTHNGQRVAVKIWYGLRPDPRRPEEAHQILRFLERARAFQSQHGTIVPETIDFGLSDAGPYLVRAWSDGETLGQTLNDQRTPEQAITLCQRLAEATQRLHALGLEHGDLSPENIITANGEITFIDAIDLFTEAAPHTPAYCPPDYESIPLDQRDCYAIAKLCQELLDRTETTAEVSEILSEVQQCLSYEFRVYRLDRVIDAINRTLTPRKDTKQVTIHVYTRQVTTTEFLDSDNGAYHVSIFADAQYDHLRLSIAGPRKQLLVRIRRESNVPRWLRLQDIAYNDFTRLTERAQARTENTVIALTPSSIDSCSDLVSVMLALPDITQERARLDAPQEEALPPSQPTPTVLAAVPSTADIWRTIIEGEEATLPELEITATGQRDPLVPQTLRIPYATSGEPLDYDPEDIIEVLQEFEGELAWVGELNTRETTEATLVIDRSSPRLRQRTGEILRLRSVQDRSSFVRRRSAVERILHQESVIPNLVSYFDPNQCPPATTYGSPPTDAELDAYDLYADGRRVFTLNEQQRDAFRRIWTYGPIGLLQGPPGTGKTAFIASFIHFVLSRGANNILLASQSHEAVNNAAEKVIEITSRTGTRIQLVRFGAEGMLSDPLRPYHSGAILDTYRDLFKAEIKNRVAGLSANLGLPTVLVEALFDIEYHLGRFLREIDNLERRCNATREHTEDRRRLDERLKRRRERFEIVAREKFGIDSQDHKAAINAQRKALMQQHGVFSLDAVARLDKVIAISMEWIDRLGTDRANFEEFLAKTRTLVCGTCVGLGRAHFGVAKNRYDWVIVDEAARATPSELAVAIQSGRRVLLVGDHRQLPPLYTPQLLAHATRTLQISDQAVVTQSDFQRSFESKYGVTVGAMLKTQYRMAPPIGALVSACFYPATLEPGRGDPPPFYDALPKRLASIVTWIDTSHVGSDSFEQRNPNHSVENSYEAREIIGLLKEVAGSESFLNDLLSTVEEDELPIGVICMYSDQKRLLLKLLSEQDWATNIRRIIKIDTVDSYQGKQNRIIILSTTRHNDRYEQGYVWSPERVNVAISRAMDRLVIVGAGRMWRDRNQQAPLGRVLQYIEAHQDTKNFSIKDAMQQRRGTR